MLNTTPAIVARTLVDDPAAMNRRGFFGLLGLQAATAAAEPKDVTDNPEGQVVVYWDGAAVGRPGSFLAIESWSEASWAALDESSRPWDACRVEGLGWLRLRPASRREAMEEDPLSPPEPVATEILRGDDVATVVRHWQPGDAARCRRCRECNACPSAVRPGLDLCLSLAPVGIDLEEARGFGDDTGE